MKIDLDKSVTNMTVREELWARFASAVLLACYKGLLAGPQFAEVAANVCQMANAMIAAIEARNDDSQ